MVEHQPPDRVDPPWSGDERSILVGFLEYSRHTIELKTIGLTDAQAATPSVEPSILTLTGLVRHLAEVERNWFRRCFRGDGAPPIYYSEAHPDGDLDQVDATTSMAEAIDVWRAEIAIADEVLAECTDLGELAAVARHGNLPSMRWILVHMIEEYNRHAGHADFLRERIDGVTGD